MNECRHRPPCPAHVTKWLCSKRTDLESAVNRGLIARPAAERLAVKWRLTLTPMSKVYTGAQKPVKHRVQERLL